MANQLDFNAIQKLCSPQVQNAIARQQAGKYAAGSMINRPQTAPIQEMAYTSAPKIADTGFDDPYLVMDGTSSNSAMDYNTHQLNNEQYNERLTQMNLPEAIKKSLMEQQAVLADAPMPREGDAIERMLAQNGITARQQQILSEVQSPIQSTRPVSSYMEPQTYGFDFQTLRLVINECLDAKLNELKALNESKLSNIILKEGKIKLIDNKGNIYAATLQKQGNVNDKK